MILRAHRFSTARLCWRKAFNQFHRGYDREETWDMRSGTALHSIAEIGRTTGQWQEAIEAAVVNAFNTWPRFGLPGEEFEIEAYTKTIKRMGQLFAEHWSAQQSNVQVVVPELEAEVALPNSQHHCIFKHWRLFGRGDRFTPPNSSDILRGDVMIPPLETCSSYCNAWGPHYVAGRTDALITLDGEYWLDEFKTTSINGAGFWDEWLLDMQPTIYLYLVWKSTGILPKGVIIHGLYRPSQKQVNSWNAKRKDHSLDKQILDYVGYDRQLFTRDKADLLRCERELIDLAEEWEWRVSHGKFPMSNVRGVCTMFGRKCDFHKACLTHDEEGLEGMSMADPQKNRLYHIEAKAQ